MQYYGFDWLATVFNLAGVFLLGSKSRYGFAFCLLGSCGWLVVGFLINSFPLICGSSIFVVLHARGLINWRKKSD